MVKTVAYECEDHYSLIITEDYSLVKTLILMCNQILFNFFVPFMSVSWFAFFSSWVFVFPAQKAESPASETVTHLERWDTNQRQVGSHFQRVTGKFILQSTIPNPFSAASTWVKIIPKFISGNLENEDYKQTAFDYYLRESIAVLAQVREQRHF